MIWRALPETLRAVFEAFAHEGHWLAVAGECSERSGDHASGDLVLKLPFSYLHLGIELSFADAKCCGWC